MSLPKDNNDCAGSVALYTGRVHTHKRMRHSADVVEVDSR